MLALAKSACAAQASKTDQGGLPLGPGLFYPSASLDVRYDDNIFSQSTNTQSSMITTISLKGREEVVGDASRYTADVALTGGLYTDSSDDNYTDGGLTLKAEAFPTQRIYSGITGGFWHLHDARGTGSSQGAGATAILHPSIYNLWNINGDLHYGVSKPGTAKIELAAGYNTRKYQNNEATTKYQDRDNIDLGATFKYMIMPATSLLTQVTGKYISYDTDSLVGATPVSLDSSEYGLQVGVVWEATAATTGHAKIGWATKDFDSSARSDSDSITWDLGVNWSPSSYSTFGISTNRGFTESSGYGDFVNKSAVNIFWKHAWYDYLTSNLSFNHAQDEYGGSNRDDDINTIGLTLSYQMRRTLSWDIFYNLSERGSNDAQYEFTRNFIGVTANLKL
jgi:hypothetical protein